MRSPAGTTLALVERQDDDESHAHDIRWIENSPLHSPSHYRHKEIPYPIISTAPISFVHRISHVGPTRRPSLSKNMNLPAEPSASTSANASPARNGRARILYVEDDAALRRLCAQTLIRAGYAVTSVEDGRQGFEALHSDAYDLLITDIDMPWLSGVELVAKCRREGMDLPIIMASGSLNSSNDSACESLHLAARLQKPFALNQLLETVRQVLRTASNGRGGN